MDRALNDARKSVYMMILHVMKQFNPRNGLVEVPLLWCTRQVTRAPRLSLSRNTIMNFQTGKRYQTIRHC